MLFDKLSLFADGKAIPVAANGVTYSKVLDLRNCGQVGIDGLLRVWAGVVGDLASGDAAKITTRLQTSGNGTNWKDLVSEAQNGHLLMGVMLPCRGLKRFLRLTFTVGGTALTAAVAVKAGLVDQFDIDELPEVYDFTVEKGGHGLVDGLGIADLLASPLAVAETAKSVSKGGNADVGISGGFVTGVTASAKYTVTVTQGSKVNITLASDAADGSVVLVDGLGVAHAIAVTAA